MSRDVLFLFLLPLLLLSPSPSVRHTFIHLVLPRVSILLPLLLLLDQLYLLVRSIAPTPLRIPLQPSHAIASIFLPRFRNVCEPITLRKCERRRMVTKIWITLRKCERRRKERWPRKLELHCENVSGRGRNGGHENLDWNTTGSGYELIILILILIRSDS